MSQLRRLALSASILFCFTTSLAWSSASAEEKPLPKGNAEHGEKLYLRYCRGCHGVDGQGDALVFMPHVNNLTRKGYVDQLPDTYLLLAITKGGLGIGKSSYMPAWEGTLTEAQMLDIIAHIRSLPLHEGAK